MNRDLTEGNVTKSLLYFAAPMILGNLLQQCYNIADTWVVGQYAGAQALAAVPGIGVLGIWWAIPIGWALADVTGFVIMGRRDRASGRAIH